MNTHDLEQTLQISLQHLCVPVHADDALEFDLGLHTHHMVTMSSATHPRELLSLEISTFDVQPTDQTYRHHTRTHTHRPNTSPPLSLTHTHLHSCHELSQTGFLDSVRCHLDHGCAQRQIVRHHQAGLGHNGLIP